MSRVFWRDFYTNKIWKHDTSNAWTHAYDVRQLFDSEQLENKPIFLIESDGAQDEAPR